MSDKLKEVFDFYSSDDAFKERPDHKQWYRNDHIDVVERISRHPELTRRAPGADPDLTRQLIAYHDIEKAVHNENPNISREDTFRRFQHYRDLGPEAREDLHNGLNYMERIKKGQGAVHGRAGDSARVASTADALSHYTNGPRGFLSIYSNETKPNEDMEVIKASNQKKLEKDKNKMILLTNEEKDFRLEYNGRDTTTRFPGKTAQLYSVPRNAQAAASASSSLVTGDPLAAATNDPSSVVGKGHEPFRRGFVTHQQPNWEHDRPPRGQRVDGPLAPFRTGAQEILKPPAPRGTLKFWADIDEIWETGGAEHLKEVKEYEQRALESGYAMRRDWEAVAGEDNRYARMTPAQKDQFWREQPAPAALRASSTTKAVPINAQPPTPPVSSPSTSPPTVHTSGPRPEARTPEDLLKRNGKVPPPRDSRGRFTKAPTYSIPSADFSSNGTSPIPSRRMVESFPSIRERPNSTVMAFAASDIHLDPHKRALSNASYSGLDSGGNSNWEGLDSKNVISESPAPPIINTKPNIENDMRLTPPPPDYGRVARSADTMGWGGTEASRFDPSTRPALRFDPKRGAGPAFDNEFLPVSGVVNPRSSQSAVFADQGLPSLRDFPSLNDSERIANLRGGSPFDSMPNQGPSANELALHNKGPILFGSDKSIVSKSPRTNWQILGAGLVGGAIIGRRFAGEEDGQKTAGMTMGAMTGMTSANLIYNEYLSQEKNITREYRKSLREAGSIAERPTISMPQDYIGDRPQLLEGRSPHQITDRISLSAEGLVVDPTTTAMKYDAAPIRLKAKARVRANSARTKNKMITAGLAAAAAVATAGVGLSFSGGDKSSGINSQRGL